MSYLHPSQARPLFMQPNDEVDGPLDGIAEFQSLKRDPCLCNSFASPERSFFGWRFNRSSATPVYATDRHVLCSG